MIMKLNIGCGNNYLDGFVNMDISADIRKDVMGDVRQIPLADNSCSFIACNHVLEHLSEKGINLAFSELRRVLENNGKIRLSMPNLLEAVKKPLGQRNIDIFGLGRWGGDVHKSAFIPDDIIELAHYHGFQIDTVPKKDWFDTRHNNNSNMEFELS